MVRLLIALQSAAAVPILPIDFDLKKAPVSKDSNSIVVTGRRQSQRIEREPFSTEPPLGRAEIGLFGKMKGNLHVESKSMGDGTTSQRVMVGIKLPF